MYGVTSAKKKVKIVESLKDKNIDLIIATPPVKVSALQTPEGDLEMMQSMQKEMRETAFFRSTLYNKRTKPLVRSI